MLALLTTLALAATTGLQDAKPQDPPAKAQPKIATTAHILRAIRTQIETARLEINELGKPQAALTRCEQLVLDLYVPTTQSGSIEERAECLRLLSEVLELRSSILESKAKSLGVKSSARGGAKSVFLGQSERFARSSRRGPTTSPLAPDIDAEIERNALAGHTDFVLEIGERAVPGLLRALAKTPDMDFKNPADDPLYMLMMVDPFAADTYVGTLNNESDLGETWERRFARSVALAGPFAGDQTWITPSMHGNSTHLENLLERCEALLTEPKLVEDICRSLGPFAKRHAYTPQMIATVGRSVDSGEMAGSVARWWLRHSWPQGVPRAQFLKGLGSPHPTIADLSETYLKNMATNEGVFDVILRGTVEQRSRGVSWLGPRKVFEEVPPNSADGNWTSWGGARGAAASSFLDQLLRDPIPEVRTNTLRAVLDLPTDRTPLDVGAWAEYGVQATTIEQKKLRGLKLSPAILTQLASDPEIEQELVARVAELLPDESRIQFALALARANGNTMRPEVMRLFAGLDWYGHPQRSIEAVRAAGLNASELKAFVGTAAASKSFASALHSQKGLDAMASWAIETESSALLRFVCFDGLDNPRPQLTALPADRWASMLASQIVSKTERGKPSLLPARLTSLIRFRVDNEARSACCAYATSAEGLSFRTLYLLLNCAPPAAQFAAMPGMLRLVRALDADDPSLELWLLLAKYSAAFREKFSSRVVTSQGITPWQIGYIFTHGGKRMAVTPEVVDYAIKHSAKSPELGGITSRVLEWMATHPEHADIPWINRLILGEHHVDKAVSAAGRLRHPDLLIAIGTVIRDSATNTKIYGRATRALTHYLSDEAAELLLIAARKVGDGETRDACLAHLEAIATLQDAENRWATRRVNQATREVTVSKLLGLLDQEDATVRVEAIRALATWEAVEALPRLIELLKDADPKIKAAARAALDRINSQQ